MRTIDKIIHGLAIIAVYEGAVIAIDETYIYAGPYRPSEMSQKDKATLESLGWTFDKSLDTWKKPV